MKMMVLDFLVGVLFVGALMILGSYWENEMDLYMTILGLMVAVVAGMTAYTQYRKIRMLSEKSSRQ